LEFRGNFRSGYISYIEGDKKCDFVHEIGGGGCAFYIEIPSEEKWEIETGFQLEKRNEIIEYLAESLRAKENNFYRYEVRDGAINFYQL
jgi:hypothetical protein